MRRPTAARRTKMQIKVKLIVNANIQSVVSTLKIVLMMLPILMQYQNMNEVVQIVKNLSSSKMAEILSEMTPSFAANILQLMNN